MTRHLSILMSMGLLACADAPVENIDPVLGSLDKALIDDVIYEDLDPIRSCYQQALTLDPKLEGKLVTQFVIGADGFVEGSEIKEDQLGRDDVADCVLDRIEMLEFPPPAGGGIVIVSYPFVFSPG